MLRAGRRVEHRHGPHHRHQGRTASATWPPARHPPGEESPRRYDGAGCTHDVIKWLHGQQLSSSVGFTLPPDTPELLALILQDVWQPAYDAHDKVRDGAWVAEPTDLVDLTGWPPGMRVVIRKEAPTLIPSCASPTSMDTASPHSPPTHAPAVPGRSSPNSSCVTAAGRAARTVSPPPRTPVLRTFPLHDFAQNQIWLTVAAEITAWMQTLTLTDVAARRPEPKRIRLRIFTIPATIARYARRTVLHQADTAPWASLVHQGLQRLRRLAAPC